MQIFSSTRYGSSIPRGKVEVGLKGKPIIINFVSFLIFLYFLQLTKREDTLLQQKAEIIFRDNIPQWKVNLDDGGDDDAKDDGNQGGGSDLRLVDYFFQTTSQSVGWFLTHLSRWRWQLSAVRGGGWSTWIGICQIPGSLLSVKYQLLEKVLFLK